MAHFLSNQQLLELTQIHTNITTGGSVDYGKWYLAYRYLESALSAPGTVFGTYNPISPEVAPQYMFFRGAAEINYGWGAFSAFIREYTNQQYFLRTGTALDQDTMQDVSNDIAKAIVEEIIWGSEPLDPSEPPRPIIAQGEIPTLLHIGLVDAGTTVGRLYNNEDDFSSWSGCPLYIPLAESQFFTDHILDAHNRVYDILAFVASTQTATVQAGYTTLSSFDDFVDAFDVLRTLAINITFPNPQFVAELTVLANTMQGHLQTVFPDLPADLDIVWFSDITMGRLNEADTLDGGSDGDFIHGGGGDDLIFASTGRDYIDGGDGADTLDYSELGARIVVDRAWHDPQTDLVSYGLVKGAENGPRDTFANVETLRLGGLDDAFHVHAFHFDTGVVPLDVYGNDGRDTIDLSAAGRSITFDGTGTLPGTGLTFHGFERVIGSTENDVFNLEHLFSDVVVDGGSGADNLSTGHGVDTLEGGSGNDTLYGDIGIDLLMGGDGNDLFVTERQIYHTHGSIVFGGAGADTVMISGLMESESWWDTTSVLLITLPAVDPIAVGAFFESGGFDTWVFDQMSFDHKYDLIIINPDASDTFIYMDESTGTQYSLTPFDGVYAVTANDDWTHGDFGVGSSHYAGYTGAELFFTPVAANWQNPVLTLTGIQQGEFGIDLAVPSNTNGWDWPLFTRPDFMI